MAKRKEPGNSQKAPELGRRITSISHPAFRLAENEAFQNEDAERPMAHYQPLGSSGTEIFSGYFTEEYLQTLQGQDAADIYDKMRRSDAKVKMVLSAVKNPIKGATWQIEPAGETPEQAKHAELIDHILFSDMEKSFQQFVNEALSVVDFGHAVFEVIHKVVVNDPGFGSYNGIRQLGFRSQRTIERWNLNRETGSLDTLEQNAYGDVGKAVVIPGQFLLTLALDKEGDNYEGISGLRAVYGPWLRKQMYLKLMAIGIEKSAIPTPVATVPEGKDNSKQLLNMIEVLKKYVSHESNFITKPTGWEIDFVQNPFDPEKLKSAIEFENKEMVFAFLANFLELGMTGGGGSYALSFDLSDFFLGGIEHIAQMICEQVNMQLIPSLVKLNFGPQPAYPKLKCTGISDRVGQELATIVKDLVQSKVIIPDGKLEENLRERLGLPKAEMESQRQVQTPQGFFQATESVPRGTMRLAEKPKPIALIESKTESLQEIMKKHLNRINSQLIDSIMKKRDNLTDTTEVDAIKMDATGIEPYRRELLQFYIDTADAARRQVVQEIPTKVRPKLAERSIRLAEINDLPPKTRKKVQAQAQLMADSQVADLEKNVKFQYASSISSTDSTEIIRKDLMDAGRRFIDGPAVLAAAGNQVADIVNASRLETLFDDSVFEEVESFTFVNPDPVSEVCQELNGVTFQKDDPESERFYPPLHTNCKSILVPNFKGRKGNPEISPGLRPSPEAQKSINLAEDRGELQTVVISKKIAQNLDVAKKMAKEFGAEISKVDETADSYRFRQKEPGQYESFRSFSPKEGVTLVYGRT